MKIIRQIFKPAATFLAFYLVMLSGPYQFALAEIIGTETLLPTRSSNEARDYVNSILERENVQTALIVQGIDPTEVKKRIDSLSDAEINAIAGKLEQLPAGGFFETFLIVAFLIFVILIFTDIAGYTDVFPFVNKGASTKTDRGKTVGDTRENAVKEPNAEEADSASASKIEVKPDKNMIIYFEQDSNELSDKAIEKLDRIFEITLNNPDSELTMTGFPGSEGSASYNKMLSENRVSTVKMYLVGKGLSSNRTKAGIYNEQINAPINCVEIKINFNPRRE